MSVGAPPACQVCYRRVLPCVYIDFRVSTATIADEQAKPLVVSFAVASHLTVRERLGEQWLVRLAVQTACFDKAKLERYMIKRNTCGLLTSLGEGLTPAHTN